MAMILALFGLLLAVAGIVLFLKAQKLIGALLMLIGIAFVALSAVAILNFHP